jgi:hypothetical protein
MGKIEENGGKREKTGIGRRVADVCQPMKRKKKGEKQ